jgi:23S rRNA pseudouridine1911/1915/1917 synthase
VSRPTIVVVDGAGAGRLDAFLRRALPQCSRRLLRRLVADGAVRVDGRPAAKGTILTPGDRVELPPLGGTLPPEPVLALAVLHEDAAVVAVDKPGGMPGHALDPRERGTAAAFLVARWPELAGVGDALAPGLVHRLDTGTSGILVAARTASAHARLRTALRARAVVKRYLAVVAGDARALDGVTVDAALGHDPRDRSRMVAARPGIRTWPARTAFRVLAHGATRSLVEATIRTGVTHQVRVHLALAGHPVLNDARYGGPVAALAPGRHALHASAFAGPHPDGGTLAVASPLPAELARLAP